MSVASAAATSAGGCGCGGSCGARASGASGAGALTRPKFFAGQLLTEDDLQQLVDYVVEKQRMHNRYLFGDGVACGLEVSCDPCDPGHVTVAPGYAIDCCGNDVVVSCPASVDVLAMVRELRTQLRGGQDCGDPCAEDRKLEPSKDTSKDDPAALKDRAKEKLKSGTRDRIYCLYVRYADEEIDPVAPYATDDACAGSACEPTRVREGYRFELRCRQADAPPDDVLAHALSCIGDFIDAESSFSSARAITQHARRLEEAQQIYDLYELHYEPITFGQVYEAQLQQRVNELGRYLDDYNTRHDDADGAIDAFRALATLAARWFLQTGWERRALRSHSWSVVETVQDATRVVERARGLLPDVLGQLETGADRILAQQMFTLSATSVPVWSPDEPDLPEDPQRSYEALLFAAGAPHSAFLQGELADRLAFLRRELLDRVGESPRTHCDLVRQIDQLLEAAPTGAQLGRADVDRLLASVDRLTESLLRYFQDCFCAALNPSCASCTDPAVLLACLRVDGCEVTDICNMGRRWILSAANLRYWLGPLRIVSRLLEYACCEPIRKPRPLPSRQPQPEPTPSNNYFSVENAPRPAAAAAAVPRTATMGRLSLVDVIASPDFGSDDLPDLLVGELASIYLPGGNPNLRFADFARVAEQLGRMVAARYGAESSRRTTLQGGQKDGEILTVLASPVVKKAVESIAVDALVRQVEEKKLDLGGALERSAETTLERLRAERGQAVRDELTRWAASEDGLATSVRPAVEAAVDRHVPELEQRQREELERVVRNSGLDTSSMTQRIGASVDAKVAALGLNRESLDARISSTMQGTLAANGLVADALARRFDDAIRTRLDTEGLEREAIDRRLGLAVRSALASEGFTATALGERIQAEVAQSFAREGLTSKSLEERVDGRLRAAIQPLLETELKRYAAGGSAAALDRVDSLTRELETLRADHAALVKKLADGDHGGGPAPASKRRKKEE